MFLRSRSASIGCGGIHLTKKLRCLIRLLKTFNPTFLAAYLIETIYEKPVKTCTGLRMRPYCA